MALSLYLTRLIIDKDHNYILIALIHSLDVLNILNNNNKLSSCKQTIHFKKNCVLKRQEPVHLLHILMYVSVIALFYDRTCHGISNIVVNTAHVMGLIEIA